ncbi:MAG TPA: fumarylacetoacetate hydrolase family protein [Solirubrobacteraceae bacterium]|nr:fumarylacetoacetate hydrolase family protein [Solirubrobacteraceae bacterium]
MATALADTDIEAAVDQLDRAERTRRPVALAAGDGSFSIADGYRIQRAWERARLAAGARRTGWKVGATSPESQRALGFGEPMFGPLLSDTELGNGGECAVGELVRPLCEAELAFMLGAPLAGDDVDQVAAIAATSALAAAIEIVDSRVTRETVGPEYVVADRGRAARYAVGEWVPVAAVADTAAVSVTVFAGGREVAGGSGARVLGDPARSLAWLAGALAQHGLGLEAGDVVLTGTLIAPLPIASGQRIRALFDGPLGAVELGFA